MNSRTPRVILLLSVLLLSFFSFFACTKDQDIFEQAISEDIQNNINSNESDEEGEETEEEPIDSLITIGLTPVHDAYLQDSQGFDEPIIRVEKDKRVGYLLFDLSGIEGEIEEVSLEFTIDSDSGDGTLQIFQGLSTDWTEQNISKQSAPNNDYLLSTTSGTFEIGDINNITLDKSNISSESISLILKKISGNDFALASKESSREDPPKLLVTFTGTYEGTVESSENDENQEDESPMEDASGYNPPCDFGGSCMTPDYSCLDSSYQVIEEFIQAGVLGGIPNGLPIAKTITPSDDIQQAIDEVNSNGGGVILFAEGTYVIRDEIFMKSNVVLRGVDRENVRLESLIRGDDDNKTQTFLFDNTSYAGIENMTLFFSVPGYEPIDREGLDAGAWDSSLFSNDPYGLVDLYVTTVVMESNSSNNWIDNCNILESGWHTIRIRGNNNTVRNTFVDRAYNKGGNGRGYFNIIGDYNLIVNSTIKRIRHVNIELGAEYNVFYNNEIFVDVNFHDGDNGNNLIENNRVFTPTYHPFPVFTTGNSDFGHQLPGPNNLWVNNIANERQRGEIYSKPNTIYRLSHTSYETVIETDWEMPTCNTFYPMIRQ